MEVKDFGELVRELRIKNDYTYASLADKIDLYTVNDIVVKKWEHNVAFPSLDEIYKLSEIFMISSAELLASKQKSMEEGLKSIHVRFIRWLSFFLGFTIYGTIWFSRIIIFLALVASLLFFMSCARAI